MLIQNALKSMLMVLLLLPVGPLHAMAGEQQDYCIKCLNPDQTYICRVVSNSGQTRGKQFFCIINISKDQGHDSCSATAQSQNCSGVLVQYEVMDSPPPQIPAHQTSPNQAPITPPTVQAGKKGSPDTLVEFTKQATKATKKGLNSAGSNTQKAFKKTGKAIKKTGSKIIEFTDDVGSNIKNATKTTLKCLTSLFYNCSGQ